MTQTRFFKQVIVFALPILLIGSAAALAQNKATNGILKIHVSPKQTYVFVDDDPIRDGSQAIALAAGKNTVEVRNYGYAPKIPPLPQINK